ncbi:MAG: efflux RND transporter periplasmic adaptor subunit [Planctomycetota bacterium]
MKALGLWTLRILAGLAFLALFLYMLGVFETGTIPPGRVDVRSSLPEPALTGTAEARTIPVWYEAVGTVRSRVAAQISPQVTGRILTITVEAGDRVSEGETIATLENDELRARLEQARSGVDSALAMQEQATLSYSRIQRLFESEAATQEQLEAADALKKQADAGVDAARQKLEEAKVAEGYSRIVSPLSGVVASREADPGDLAWPGRPLVVVHDPDDLRLEASVREGLIGKVRLGQEVEVWLTALQENVSGKIEEIAPSGDPVSRSFVVKADIPSLDRVFPGMFGRMRLPIGERSAILVPAKAVTAVGQLETLLVRQGDRWVRRFVTTGEVRGELREVLSGASSGEVIGWNEESR